MSSSNELSRFRIKAGQKVDLKQLPTHGVDGNLDDLKKEGFESALERTRHQLDHAQELLYASDTKSVLLIFQAMDAAGKDGTIRHVMSGVNPQGCQVFSFKVPSAEELDHNFLWRYSKALPERGRIGIFNRSYYEDVLVVKVHPEFLDPRRYPKINKKFWEKRYKDINNFEKHLARNGTLILKFFLHISKEEQRQRFLARLNEPAKQWKFSEGDIKERARWDDYMAAFEDAIEATSTKHAPWFVIPADQKSFARATVAEIIAAAVHRLQLEVPQLSTEQQAKLAAVKQQLESESGPA